MPSGRAHPGAHVTGVCSTANVTLVRSLGAADVVDYTKVVFDAVGRQDTPAANEPVPAIA